VGRGVAVLVAVGAGLGVHVGVGLDVRVGVGLDVGVRVAVALGVGLGVSTGVGVRLGVALAVALGVAVEVCVALGLREAIRGCPVASDVAVWPAAWVAVSRAAAATVLCNAVGVEVADIASDPSDLGRKIKNTVRRTIPASAAAIASQGSPKMRGGLLVVAVPAGAWVRSRAA
jgi:hypothetical protein